MAFPWRFRAAVAVLAFALGLYLAWAGWLGAKSDIGADRPATDSRPAATSPATAPTTIPGVENFAQVSPVLYRGAQPTAEGFAELKKRGIKTIINLRAIHSDRDKLAGTGLRYVHFSCKAWHPEDEDVVRVLKVIEDPANQPVFVHCQQGADRTGTMVAGYRLVVQGWPVEEAVKELNAFGFHPIWTQISAYLRRFDREKIAEEVRKTKEPEVEVVK